MDIVLETSVISIERRTLTTVWMIKESYFSSLTAAEDRIDYLRSIAGTEIYRITETKNTVFSY